MSGMVVSKINNRALLTALQHSAPVDLRVNMAERNEVKSRLKNEGLFFANTPYSPLGLRSEERVNLNNCIAYQEGLCEVQDEASQLAAILCDVSADDKVIDYCAGAGGKVWRLPQLIVMRGRFGRMIMSGTAWTLLKTARNGSESVILN